MAFSNNSDDGESEAGFDLFSYLSQEQKGQLTPEIRGMFAEASSAWAKLYPHLLSQPTTAQVPGNNINARRQGDNHEDYATAFESVLDRDTDIDLTPKASSTNTLTTRSSASANIPPFPQEQANNQHAIFEEAATFFFGVFKTCPGSLKICFAMNGIHAPGEEDGMQKFVRGYIAHIPTSSGEVGLHYRTLLGSVMQHAGILDALLAAKNLRREGISAGSNVSPDVYHNDIEAVISQVTEARNFPLFAPLIPVIDVLIAHSVSTDKIVRLVRCLAWQHSGPTLHDEKASCSFDVKIQHESSLLSRESQGKSDRQNFLDMKDSNPLKLLLKSVQFTDDGQNPAPYECIARLILANLRGDSEASKESFEAGIDKLVEDLDELKEERDVIKDLTVTCEAQHIMERVALARLLGVPQSVVDRTFDPRYLSKKTSEEQLAYIEDKLDVPVKAMLRVTVALGNDAQGQVDFQNFRSLLSHFTGRYTMVEIMHKVADMLGGGTDEEKSYVRVKLQEWALLNEAGINRLEEELVNAGRRQALMIQKRKKLEQRRENDAKPWAKALNFVGLRESTPPKDVTDAQLKQAVLNQEQRSMFALRSQTVPSYGDTTFAPPSSGSNNAGFIESGASAVNTNDANNQTRKLSRTAVAALIFGVVGILFSAYGLASKSLEPLPEIPSVPKSAFIAAGVVGLLLLAAVLAARFWPSKNLSNVDTASVRRPEPAEIV